MVVAYINIKTVTSMNDNHHHLTSSIHPFIYQSIHLFIHSSIYSSIHPFIHPFIYRLIEEFMLLTNMAVARCISTKFPDIALLRRHPPPKGKSIESLVSSFNDYQTFIFIIITERSTSYYWSCFRFNYCRRSTSK